jgi:hypothetical protein
MAEAQEDLGIVLVIKIKTKLPQLPFADGLTEIRRST